jgi:DNA-binding FadR family transcriptional regulator
MTPSPRRRYSSGCLSAVVDGLRQRIVSGDYRAGDRLPTEPQLQIDWGVSRSVIREAMKILASQGLVRVEQGRGSFVNEVDHGPLRRQLEIALLRSESETGQKPGMDDWDALLDLRSVLEVGAASRAAQHATPEEIDDMQAAIDAMKRHPGDAAACSQDDFNFHLALARATRNPLWPAIVGSLHGLLSKYLALAHHGAQNGLITVNEHQGVLDALRSRDATAATQAMTLHINTSRRDLSTARATKAAVSPAARS